MAGLLNCATLEMAAKKERKKTSQQEREKETGEGAAAGQSCQ